MYSFSLTTGNTFSAYFLWRGSNGTSASLSLWISGERLDFLGSTCYSGSFGASGFIGDGYFGGYGSSLGLYGPGW